MSSKGKSNKIALLVLELETDRSQAVSDLSKELFQLMNQHVILNCIGQFNWYFETSKLKRWLTRGYQIPIVIIEYGDRNGELEHLDKAVEFLIAQEHEAPKHIIIYSNNPKAIPDTTVSHSSFIQKTSYQACAAELSKLLNSLTVATAS